MKVPNGIFSNPTGSLGKFYARRSSSGSVLCAKPSGIKISHSELSVNQLKLFCASKISRQLNSVFIQPFFFNTSSKLPKYHSFLKHFYNSLGNDLLLNSSFFLTNGLLEGITSFWATYYPSTGYCGVFWQPSIPSGNGSLDDHTFVMAYSSELKFCWAWETPERRDEWTDDITIQSFLDPTKIQIFLFFFRPVGNNYFCSNTYSCVPVISPP